MITPQALYSYPSIVRQTQSTHNGICSVSLKRHCIGYLIRGTKHIYYGDERYTIARGNVFYLKPGTHYIEDLPEGNQSLDQIFFFYTSEQLGRTLQQLSQSYRFTVPERGECPLYPDRADVSYSGWPTLKTFFGAVNSGLREGSFEEGNPGTEIKFTELIYLLLSHPDCILKGKLLCNLDTSTQNFDRLIQEHLFTDISIEELARQSNRSLTSFKKEFTKRYAQSPHKWIIMQRLLHARLLIISTEKPVAEVGGECGFSNTSHFIKLFKRQYGVTPALYRNQHGAQRKGADNFSAHPHAKTSCSIPPK